MSEGTRMDVPAARAFFPGLQDKTFLDAACVSLAPIQAKQAISTFLDTALLCPERDASIHHIAMDALRQTALNEGAKLLGAHPEEMALIESTTHGLNIAAQAIVFSPHQNVILVDLEFLQVAIPWVKMQEAGLLQEVRMVKNTGGEIPIESIAAHVDKNTKAIIVSSVQWSNGYRMDLKPLSDLCRDAGIFLIVDAIHQLGAVELDVTQFPIDILISGGHKWLNSPFGCGLLYVRKEIQPQLRQTSWGYLGLEDPEGGWGRYFATPSITPLRPYHFPPTAKRFETNGTANYPGAIGLGESLKLVNALGIKQVEQHVLHLEQMVYTELERMGLNVITPPNPATRSGITVFQAYRDPDANERLLQRCLDDRVYLAMRYTSGVGGIRVFTHYFNNEDDLDTLFRVLRKHLA